MKNKCFIWEFNSVFRVHDALMYIHVEVMLYENYVDKNVEQ